MPEMLSVKEVAKRWNVPEQQVSRYCRENRIPGADRKGRSWLIPSNAEKPQDKRRKSRKALEHSKTSTKLPLPIGVSDFRVACD